MTQRVPVFGLYGEKLYQSDPGTVHVESIFERSSLNSWHIQPHLHNELLQILLVREGAGQVSLSEFTHDLMGGTCIFIPAGTIHSFTFQPATDGYVISLKQEVIDSIKPDTGEFFDITRAGICKLGDRPQVFDEMIRLTQRLESELKERNQNRQSFCATYGALLLALILRENQRTLWDLASSLPRPNLAQRFLAMVERDFTAHRRVECFAAELGISSSSLHRLCKFELGLSPKEAVQGRLVQEAKRRLVYTTDTVEQISDKLGFSESGYFSRFFKKRTGYSPRTYRKKYRDAV